MNRNHWVWAIIFFPITVYLAIGTTLLSIVSLIDRIVQVLGNYSGFPFLGDFEAKDWHRHSPWFTAIFPVTWPFLFGFSLLILVYSIIAAILRVIYDVLEYIWNFVVDILTTVWKAAVSSIDAIWGTVTPGAVGEQTTNQTGPKPTTILVISFSLFCISCLVITAYVRNPRFFHDLRVRYESVNSTATSSPNTEVAFTQSTSTPFATSTKVPAPSLTPPQPTPKQTSLSETNQEEYNPSPSAPAGVVIVKVSSANLRSGPGTNYSWAGNAKEGDQLEVFARNSDGTWLQLDMDGKVWIAASIVKSDMDIFDLPVSAATP